MNKLYAEYRQRELNEKGEKTENALGKHVINLYSTGISRWLKIKDVKKLRQDIQDDPIIKDQMAGLGCLFVCTFGNYFGPVSIAARTWNNLDCGAEPENEDYGSDQKIVGISMDLFVSCDWIQKFFDPKRTTNKDVFCHAI